MRLKALRRERGLSLRELGDILGVAESTVSLYENEKREASYSILQKSADYFGVSIDYLLGGAEQEKENGKNPHCIHIPVLESVSLSKNELEYHYSADQEFIELGNPDEYFYLKMHGESMAPQIADGDIALIKKQTHIESGDVAAVIYGDNPVMLKRIIKNCSVTLLQPFNPKFQSIFVNNPDEIIILGRLTEIIRKW